MYTLNTKDRQFYDLWSKKQDAAFTRRLAFYCAQRSGIFSDDLMKLVTENDIKALCAFSIDYQYSHDIRDLQYARQCLAFYSKDADLSIVDTERAMWVGFAESEIQNRATNKRWSALFQSGKLFTCEDSFVFEVLRKITEWLGPVPSLDELDIAFGPGASATVRKRTSPRYKLDAEPTCSKEFSTIIENIVDTDMPHYWSLHKGQYKVIPGRLSSVLKNAFTRRTILMEPTLNTPYQKGVGRHMKRRLLQAGCNLYDQTVNQQLALLGSITNELVTVDVKNASNTQALLMVYHSCPETWFDLLWSLRTGTVNYEGREHELEMFSSMGNGFTFELESLIFYAIAVTVCERNNADTALVSVYGDDIIVPSICYEDLVTALRFYGFEVNSKKSYSKGPFRESCGADYFLGTNIRPFYKKDRWTDARIVGLLNKDFRDFRLFDDEFVIAIKATLANGNAFRGPDGYGDGHLIYDFNAERDLRPVVQTRKQMFRHGTKDGYVFDTIIKVPLKDTSNCIKGDQLYPAYQIYLAPQLKSRRIRLIDKFVGPLQPKMYRYYFTQYIEVLEAHSDPVMDGLHQYKDVSSLEDDPYIVRGGYKSRKIAIYTFRGQHS